MSFIGSLEEAEKVSIVILGDGGTGKSCITMRLVRSHWVDEYDPTIEDSYTTVREIDGREYELEIIDTAGQEEYRGLLSGLWQAGNLADAYLLVYDITVPESLTALEHFVELVEHAQEINHATVPPAKIVAGNKCDLVQARQVSSTEGLLWARQHGCSFTETSALEMVNIEETFETLVRRVLETRKLQLRLLAQSALDELAAGNSDDERFSSGSAAKSPTTTEVTAGTTLSASTFTTNQMKPEPIKDEKRHSNLTSGIFSKRRKGHMENEATCCIIS